MSEDLKKLLVLTVLYGLGLGLIWWSTSWVTVIGVFVTCWAMRVQLTFEGR